jgi:hypothetical protein
MFQKKLLILLFSFILVSCSKNLIDYNELEKYYIAPISELHGMALRNELLVYFPAQDINNIEYIVNITPTVSDDLFLTDSRGYATRGTVYLNINLIITEKKSGKQVLSLVSRYQGFYNISSSPIATRVSKERALENLANQVARDVSLKIYGFNRKSHENIDK